MAPRHVTRPIGLWTYTTPWDSATRSPGAAHCALRVRASRAAGLQPQRCRPADTDGAVEAQDDLRAGHGPYLVPPDPTGELVQALVGAGAQPHGRVDGLLPLVGPGHEHVDHSQGPGDGRVFGRSQLRTREPGEHQDVPASALRRLAQRREPLRLLEGLPTGDREATDRTGHVVQQAGDLAAGYLTQETDPVFGASDAAVILAADITAWDATTAEVDGSSDGIVDSRIDDLETNFDDLEADKLGRVSTDMTLTVPGDHALLSDALAWLDGYAIDNAATVTIEIDAGTHIEPEAVVVTHQDGHRIEIIGSGVSQTTLEFADSDGVVVTGGTALGYLGELTLTSSGGSGSGLVALDSSAVVGLGSVDILAWTSGFGIHVSRNASVAVEAGADVVLDGCYRGALIEEGGFADLTGAVATNNLSYGFWINGGQLDAEDAESSNNGSMGFYAKHGASLQAGGATAFDNGSRGFGIYAGSTAYVHSANSSNNYYEGFLVGSGSYLDATSATAQSNGEDGFRASIGAVLAAADSFSTANGRMGYASTEGSTLYVTSSTASSNATAAYRTDHNGYIRGSALGDDSVSSSYHDTTNFIFGVP